MLCNLKLKHPPPRSIIIKLHGILTPRLKLKLRNVWDITRSRKEGGYVWSIWHKAVAINAWRARFIQDIKNEYHLWMVDTTKTIAHRFRDCRFAKRAWDFSVGILNTMITQLGQKGPWRPLDWQHKNVGKKILTSFSKTFRVWLLLTSITLWTIWIKRNDFTFNNTRWDVEGHKKSYGKTFLNTLKLRGIRRGWVQKSSPSMMMWLTIMIMCGDGMSFSTTETTQKPCIGTFRGLKQNEFIMFRLFTCVIIIFVNLRLCLVSN